MPTMTIKPIFSFGDIVYHVTDPNQNKGVIVNYEVHPKGLKYTVSFNGDTETFYAFELTDKQGEITKKEEPEEDE